MGKLLLLLSCVSMYAQAQIPFVETLFATDTETCEPTFYMRASPGCDFGIAFFEFGQDSMDLYDQTNATVLTSIDTVTIFKKITVYCDSFYYYQAFVLNDYHSAAGEMRYFDAASCVGITENSLLSNWIHIAPNPVVSISEIRAPSGTHFEIYNLLGQKKKVVQCNGLDLIFKSDFSPGVYIYRASNDGETVNGKFCVE